MDNPDEKTALFNINIHMKIQTFELWKVGMKKVLINSVEFTET